MKKILLAVALLSCIGLAENNEITIRGGFSGTNFNQNDNTATINQNTKMSGGGFLGVEYARGVSSIPDLKLGVGMSIGGVSGSDEDLPNKSVNGKAFTNNYRYENSVIVTIPVYALVKYEFSNSSSVTPYVIGRIGYDIADTKNEVKFYPTGETSDLKIKNGFYYGLGGGIKLSNWNFEVSYDNTSTKTSYSDKRYRIDDSKKNLGKVNLAVGYTFKF
ncbi:hypothetical protein [Sebaldella sp. S0638]|uniref:hypothetical protein n=1 Tax=Sebaldella sp. S0638 TaxID=2957809 RepID=UPI00209D8CE8|nr:hypothetical protein [Sebaldella sp. S0638]MCP1223011.1 hypothetical protein [Sebaldella sp. S0638]